MERMGLFQQRPEEEENQWALPSEPLERSASEVLDDAPPVDPMALGVGLGLGLDSASSVTSIAFPVAPPPAAEFSLENREPEDGADGEDGAHGANSGGPEA